MEMKSRDTVKDLLERPGASVLVGVHDALERHHIEFMATTSTPSSRPRCPWAD